jgi:hypothetical protein
MYHRSSGSVQGQGQADKLFQNPNLHSGKATAPRGAAARAAPPRAETAAAAGEHVGDAPGCSLRAGRWPRRAVAGGASPRLQRPDPSYVLLRTERETCARGRNETARLCTRYELW